MRKYTQKNTHNLHGKKKTPLKRLKTPMEILLLAIASYGVYQWLEFEKFKKTFNVKISKVAFDFNRSLKDSFKQVWIDLTITVNNPTQLEQTLSSLNLTASYNGKAVGVVNTATAIKLKEGVNVYVFPIALQTVNLFGSVQNAITAFKNKTGIKLTVTGSTKIGSYDLPINQTFVVA